MCQGFPCNNEHSLLTRVTLDIPGVNHSGYWIGALRWADADRAFPDGRVLCKNERILLISQGTRPICLDRSAPTGIANGDREAAEVEDSHD
jgi:hypothetical protein